METPIVHDDAHNPDARFTAVSVAASATVVAGCTDPTTVHRLSEAL